MATVGGWSDVGERIRSARTQLGLTQADLARRIDVERTVLVKMEGGERHVSALELARLASALDVPVAYLVTTSPGPIAAYRAAVADASTESSDVEVDRSRFRMDLALENHASDATWLLEHRLLVPAPVLRAAGAKDGSDAISAALLARQRLGVGHKPIGGLLSALETLGLYLKVVPFGTAGASLQIEPGFGVAVIGGESDPGRRRSTAAHELGHHLFGDVYNSDVGVAASKDERERLVETFAAEFLLPRTILEEGLARSTELNEKRAELVRIAGTYRVSWMTAVNSARQIGVLTRADVARLRAAAPTKGDFLAVIGAEPRPDLVDRTGANWRRAVLAAWRRKLITASRTIALLDGALTIDDLPERDDQENP